MLYLSQILKSKVTDSSDKVAGRLKDILIKPQHGYYSPLLFLCITGKDKNDFFIPYEHVENLSREEISLSGLVDNLPRIIPPVDAVWLNRDVMDQQIMDVEGARVVRVNDLRIGLFNNSMCVLGIDISFKGLIRRMGLPGLDFMDLLQVHLIDWRQAQPIKGVLKLDTMRENLKRLHPAELANIVEDLNVKRGSSIVGSLDPRAAAKVVEELDPQVQKLIIHSLGAEKAVEVMEQMSVDEVVDLLKGLPDDEAEELKSRLEIHKAKKVERLINYPDDSAGGLMSTEFVTARPAWTVADTIEEIKRQSPMFHSITYVYVTDDNGYFHGAISLRRLLLAKPDAMLKNIIKRLSKHSVLRVNQKINDVVKTMTVYNLFSAAVLDKRNKLLGVVSIDDVMRHLVPNA